MLVHMSLGKICWLMGVKDTCSLSSKPLMYLVPSSHLKFANIQDVYVLQADTVPTRAVSARR